MSDLREVNINSQGFPITDEGAREILKQKVSKTINNKEITITEEVSLYVGGYSTVNISASSATAFKYKLDDGSYVEVTTPTKITINNATTLFLDSSSYPITLTCDLISDTEIPLPRPITDTAKGSSITLTDSTDEPINAISIMGKSTQVQTKGYQLLNINNNNPFVKNNDYVRIVQPEVSNGSVIYAPNGSSTIGTESSSTRFEAWLIEGLEVGQTYTLKVNHQGTGIGVNLSKYNPNPTAFSDRIALIKSGIDFTQTFTVENNVEYAIELRMATSSEGFSTNPCTLTLMLNEGSTAKEYEPYTDGLPTPRIDYPQPIVDIESEEIEVTDGTDTQSAELDLVLRGIPVSSGGNYTDNNGQMWLCDTIERYADGTGKFIQRVGTRTFNGTERWTYELLSNDRHNFYTAISGAKTGPSYPIICNMAEYNGLLADGKALISNSGNLNFCTNAYSSADTFKAYISENNLVVVFQLNIIVETPLTAEQLAELDLDTYYPTTNINSNADVVVEYVADTKKYVDEGLNTKQDVIEDLTDYIKNTDYATNNKAGVFKTGAGLAVASNGWVYGVERSYANYLNDTNATFIAKGTLEAVLNNDSRILEPKYELLDTVEITTAIGQKMITLPNSVDDVIVEIEGMTGTQGKFLYINFYTSNDESKTPTISAFFNETTGQALRVEYCRLTEKMYRYIYGGNKSGYGVPTYSNMTYADGISKLYIGIESANLGNVMTAGTIKIYGRKRF